jgi:AcrR family transcriptional regulator
MSSTKIQRGVSKTQWLEAGLEVLSMGNVHAVTVEGLAKHMGISKSGVYWHFRDREDLLQELLKFWADKMKHLMLTDRKLLEMEPRDRLQTAAEKYCDRKLAGCELAIRQWALCDKKVKKTIQMVDQLRLGFVSVALAEFGISGEDAKLRASLYVCSVSWEPHLMEKMPRKKWRELMALRIELLTTVPR